MNTELTEYKKPPLVDIAAKFLARQIEINQMLSECRKEIMSGLFDAVIEQGEESGKR